MKNLSRKQKYYLAIITTAKRYAGLPIDAELAKFIQQLIDGCLNNMPLTKANRWLGYVQGVLIARGLTTIDYERNTTRPLFRPLDYPQNNVNKQYN